MTDVEIGDSIGQYLEELMLCDDNFDNLIIQLSNEMFYVLFQNRGFLYDFNSSLSGYNDEVKQRIPIPLWVQRAVFFRDHGICVFCGKDLSGLLHAADDREVHYDHIIPLSQNGVNDISNLQLTCKKCNLKKGSCDKTSTEYMQWYALEDERLF